MSKEKTFSLNTDMQTGNSNGCLTLQPSWSVSKLTSSSPPPLGLFSLPRRRARQFPSYSLPLPIQEMGTFPAWRDQEGISPDLASWRRI